MTNETHILCECGNKPAHPWEPGEWCPPQLVVPKRENTPARNKARVAEGRSATAKGMQSRAAKRPKRNAHT